MLTGEARIRAVPFQFATPIYHDCKRFWRGSQNLDVQTGPATARPAASEVDFAIAFLVVELHPCVSCEPLLSPYHLLSAFSSKNGLADTSVHLSEWIPSGRQTGH